MDMTLKKIKKKKRRKKSKKKNTSLNFNVSSSPNINTNLFAVPFFSKATDIAYFPDQKKIKKKLFFISYTL